MELLKDRILLTGITGYTGSHVGLALLNKLDMNRCELVATVRSLAKLEPIK